jgi:hypothetical protein
MTELERKILARLTQQKLAPTPAYVFLTKRSVFWALAILSVLLGAVASAILLFIISDYLATGWRVLDNIQFNEVLVSIPAVWVLVMAALTVSATVALRHTRRGYRFTLQKLAMWVVITSIALGTLLHFVHAGQLMHDQLFQRFAIYRAWTYVPFAEWSRPDQGFLGGTVIKQPDAEHVLLQDFQQQLWTVDVSTAVNEVDEPLIEEGDIAVEGTRTGSNTFTATRVKPFH